MFVVAANKNDKPSPFLLRNYPRRGGANGIDTVESVVDIGAATSAAPTYFAPVKLSGLDFQDGGMVCNNPTRMAMEEAKLLFPGRQIGLVVSVGSGNMQYPPESEMEHEAHSEVGSVTSAVNDAFTVSMDTERVHEEIAQSVDHSTTTYLRLNPALARVPLLGLHDVPYLRVRTKKFISAEPHKFARLAAHVRGQRVRSQPFRCKDWSAADTTHPPANSTLQAAAQSKADAAVHAALHPTTSEARAAAAKKKYDVCASPRILRFQCLF